MRHLLKTSTDLNRYRVALLRIARMRSDIDEPQDVDDLRTTAYQMVKTAEDALKVDGPIDQFERTPDGDINNCSLAFFEDESTCQICNGTCPDRAKFQARGT